MLRLSEVWYDVGYDIQSFNLTVCFEILIFLGDVCLAKLFFLLLVGFIRSQLSVHGG